MALLACAAFAVVVALAAAVSLHDAATGVIAGGFAGLWPLRFYVKAVNFARHGKRGALRSAISDLFYAAASAFSLALLHFGFSVALTLASVFASLCVGNIVGVLICVAGSGRPIRIQFRPRTFLGFARLWPDIRWSLVGTVSATILQQSQMGFVTLMAGPAAFAPIAAGFVLMSPIRILTLAVMNIMRPDLSRSNAKGDHRSAGSVVERTSSALFVLCLIHGMMLWLCWPLLQSLLFAKRFGVQPMGEIVTLAWLLTSISNGTQILQASALAKSQFREAAWPTLAGGALTLLLVPAFLLAAGAPLSTAGAIIGEIVTLYLLWARRATAPSPVVRVTERRTVLRSVNQIPQ
jgi:O-antigen/teichoic acid export membrane protein